MVNPVGGEMENPAADVRIRTAMAIIRTADALHEIRCIKSVSSITRGADARAVPRAVAITRRIERCMARKCAWGRPGFSCVVVTNYRIRIGKR